MGLKKWLRFVRKLINFLMKTRYLDKKEWSHYLSNCPQATFFHTPEWYGVWEAYAKSKAKALLFEFSIDKTALLPISERRIHKGLTKVYDSSPAGTYGGFVSPNALTAKEVGALMIYVKKMNIDLTFSPYQPLDGLDGLKMDFTQRINLQDGLDKKKWDRFASKEKRAKEDGLSVRRGVSEEDWALYFKLYEKNLKLWGGLASSTYEYSLFEILQNQRETHCQLWLVCQEGHVIYGGVFFAYNKIMIYWHGAGDRDFYKYNPAYFLHNKMVSFALKNDFRYYDFNPSGGHQGVVRFKKKFNPQKVFFPIFSNQNAWYSAIDNLSKVLKTNKV